MINHSDYLKALKVIEKYEKQKEISYFKLGELTPGQKVKYIIHKGFYEGYVVELQGEDVLLGTHPNSDAEYYDDFLINISHIRPADFPGKKFRFVEEKDLNTTLQLMNKSYYDIYVPFMVKTPVPYIIDLGHYSNEGDRRKAIKCLDKKVLELYEILGRLGISEKTAIKEKYSLNMNTTHKLTRIAGEQGKPKLYSKISSL